MHESLAPFPDLRHHLILIAYRMQEQTGRPGHGLFTLCRSTKRERGLQGKTKKYISSYFMHMQSQWSGTAVSGSNCSVWEWDCSVWERDCSVVNRAVLTDSSATWSSSLGDIFINACGCQNMLHVTAGLLLGNAANQHPCTNRSCRAKNFVQHLGLLFFPGNVIVHA